LNFAAAQDNKKFTERPKEVLPCLFGGFLSGLCSSRCYCHVRRLYPDGYDGFINTVQAGIGMYADQPGNDWFSGTLKGFV
jgi:hypothetical protein